MRIRSRKNGGWLDPNTWEGGVVPDGDDVAVIAHDVILLKPGGGEIPVGAFVILPGARLLGSQWATLRVYHDGDYDGDGEVDDVSYLGGEIYDGMAWGIIIILEKGKIVPYQTIRPRMVEIVADVELGDRTEEYA